MASPSPLSLRSAPLARAYAALRQLEEIKADEVRNPLPTPERSRSRAHSASHQQYYHHHNQYDHRHGDGGDYHQYQGQNNFNANGQHPHHGGDYNSANTGKGARRLGDFYDSPQLNNSNVYRGEGGGGFIGNGGMADHGHQFGEQQQHQQQPRQPQQSHSYDDNEGGGPSPSSPLAGTMAPHHDAAAAASRQEDIDGGGRGDGIAVMGRVAADGTVLAADGGVMVAAPPPPAAALPPPPRAASPPARRANNGATPSIYGNRPKTPTRATTVPDAISPNLTRHTASSAGRVVGSGGGVTTPKRAGGGAMRAQDDGLSQQHDDDGDALAAEYATQRGALGALAKATVGGSRGSSGNLRGSNGSPPKGSANGSFASSSSAASTTVPPYVAANHRGGFTFSRASSPTGTGKQPASAMASSPNRDTSSGADAANNTALLEKMLRELVHLRKDTHKAMSDVAEMKRSQSVQQQQAMRHQVAPSADSLDDGTSMKGCSSSLSSPSLAVGVGIHSSHSHHQRRLITVSAPESFRTEPMGHRDPWDARITATSTRAGAKAKAHGSGSAYSALGVGRHSSLTTPTQASRARRDQTLQQRAEFAAAQERARQEEELARQMRSRGGSRGGGAHRSAPSPPSAASSGNMFAGIGSHSSVQTETLPDGETYLVIRSDSVGSAGSPPTPSAAPPPRPSHNPQSSSSLPATDEAGSRYTSPRSNHAAALRRQLSEDKTRHIPSPAAPASRSNSNASQQNYTQRILEMSATANRQRRSSSTSTAQQQRGTSAVSTAASGSSPMRVRVRADGSAAAGAGDGRRAAAGRSASTATSSQKEWKPLQNRHTFGHGMGANAANAAGGGGSRKGTFMSAYDDGTGDAPPHGGQYTTAPVGAAGGFVVGGTYQVVIPINRSNSSDRRMGGGSGGSGALPPPLGPSSVGEQQQQPKSPRASSPRVIRSESDGVGGGRGTVYDPATGAEIPLPPPVPSSSTARGAVPLPPLPPPPLPHQQQGFGAAAVVGNTTPVRSASHLSNHHQNNKGPATPSVSFIHKEEESIVGEDADDAVSPLTEGPATHRGEPSESPARRDASVLPLPIGDEARRSNSNNPNNNMGSHKALPQYPPLANTNNSHSANQRPHAIADVDDDFDEDAAMRGDAAAASGVRQQPSANGAPPPSPPPLSSAVPIIPLHILNGLGEGEEGSPSASSSSSASSLPDYLAALCHAAPREWVASQLRRMLAHVASTDVAKEGRHWLAASALLNTPPLVEHIIVPMLVAELNERPRASAINASDAAAADNQRRQQLLCALVGLGPLAKGALRTLLGMMEEGLGDSKLIALAVRAVGGRDAVEALCTMARGESYLSDADMLLSPKARCVAAYALGLMPTPIIARTSVCLLASDQLKGKMSLMRPAPHDEPMAGEGLHTLCSNNSTCSSSSPSSLYVNPLEAAAAVSEDEMVCPRAPAYRVTHIFLDFEALLQLMIPFVESSPMFVRGGSSAHANIKTQQGLRGLLLAHPSSAATVDITPSVRDFLTYAPAVYENLLSMTNGPIAASLMANGVGKRGGPNANPLKQLDVSALVALLPSLLYDGKALVAAAEQLLRKGGASDATAVSLLPLSIVKGGDWETLLGGGGGASLSASNRMARLVADTLLSTLHGDGEGGGALAEAVQAEQSLVTMALLPPRIAAPLAKALVPAVQQGLLTAFNSNATHHNALAALFVAIGAVLSSANRSTGGTMMSVSPEDTKAVHVLFAASLMSVDSWRLRQACCIGMGIAGDLGEGASATAATSSSNNTASRCVKALLTSIHRATVSLPVATWAMGRMGKVGIAVLVDMVGQQHISIATRTAAVRALGALDLTSPSSSVQSKADVAQVIDISSQTLLGVVEQNCRSEGGGEFAAEAAAALGSLLQPYTVLGPHNKRGDAGAEASAYYKEVPISPLVTALAPILEASPDTITPGALMAIMGAIAANGGPHGEVLVCQWLLQSDWVTVRAAAAQSLRHCGPSVVRMLASALHDPSGMVRGEAVGSLEAIGLAPIMRALAHRPHDHSQQVLRALEGLVDNATRLPMNSGAAAGNERGRLSPKGSAMRFAAELIDAIHSVFSANE